MNIHLRAWLRAALVLASLFGLAAPAVAADAPRLVWQIGEFTKVQRVPREAGSEPNQHPRALPPEQLRSLLASLRVLIKGKSQPLFVSDEIGDLIEPLAQALAAADPGDDLLLLSSTRRGDNLLAPSTGLTARLFVQSDQLHVIVHDARLEFMGAWIGTRIPPKFNYGARSRASEVVLQSATGQARRADWQALPLGAVAVAPLSAPAAPVAPAAASARDNGFFQEQEQRLRGLKRLLEQGLISEAEFQQKRREILQTL
ncbi:MAG: SHOCT domain-containing protein [Cytophagales bacterium]|nr:SHOCT domain-containing protein [Rhizobacter sp.]